MKFYSNITRKIINLDTFWSLGLVATAVVRQREHHNREGRATHFVGTDRKGPRQDQGYPLTLDHFLQLTRPHQMKFLALSKKTL